MRYEQCIRLLNDGECSSDPVDVGWMFEPFCQHDMVLECEQEGEHEGIIHNAFREYVLCGIHCPQYGSEDWPCGYARTGGYANGLIYVPDPDGNPISNILTTQEVSDICEKALSGSDKEKEEGP